MVEHKKAHMINSKQSNLIIFIAIISYISFIILTISIWVTDKPTLHKAIATFLMWGIVFFFSFLIFHFIQYDRKFQKWIDEHDNDFYIL